MIKLYEDYSFFELPCTLLVYLLLTCGSENIISMLPCVKMHVYGLSIVLINARLLPFYSAHDSYVYVC